MRTKTLLLTASIMAAGLGASMAQVYSVNAVGYVNVPVVNGYNLIANPLNGTNNNSINVVIPKATDSSFLYAWNEAGQTFNQALTYFDFGASPDTGWYDGDNLSTKSLPPGKSFFFVNSGPAGTLTFVGEVPQGPALTNSIVANFGFYSHIVPQQIGLDATGFPGSDSMFLYFFNPGTQHYNQALTYFFFGPGNVDNGWYDGDNKVDPTPAVAQGFLIFNPSGATRQWVRSFSVN